MLTFIISMLGGVVAGFAAHPRPNSSSPVAWPWVLLLAPLWGVMFIIFGLGPVLSRTTDWLPITRNVLGFLGAAIGAYLTHHLRQRETPPQG